MASPNDSYRFRASGLWAVRHTIEGPEGPCGVLSVRRNRGGRIDEGIYRPEKGEVLFLRREPGLLRAQFSIWTEAREWLGSSLRPGVVRREIQLSTGTKPLRMLPSPGFGRGWRLAAPRTGDVATLTWNPFGRSARIDVHRRADFEVLLFAYFLGSLSGLESWFPGPQTSAAAAAATAG